MMKKYIVLASFAVAVIAVFVCCRVQPVAMGLIAMQLEETLGLNAPTNGAALGISLNAAEPLLMQVGTIQCQPCPPVAMTTTAAEQTLPVCPQSKTIKNPQSVAERAADCQNVPATETAIVSVIPVEHFKGQAGLTELVRIIGIVYNNRTADIALAPSANSLVVRATKTETEEIIALVKRLEEEAAKVKRAAQKSETTATRSSQFTVIRHPKEQEKHLLAIKLGNVSAACITDVLAEIGQQIKVHAEKDNTLVVTGTAEEVEFMRILVRAMAVAIQRVEQSKNNEPDEKITVPATPQQ